MLVLLQKKMEFILKKIKVAVLELFQLLFWVLFQVQVSELCFNFDSIFNSVFGIPQAEFEKTCDSLHHAQSIMLLLD